MAAERGGTVICCTRYGNVMCSRGSVIPLFIDQIHAGNPITITNPEMTRFLMNLDEAVELVRFAFEHANPGDLFIQKADASTIGDLAKGVQQLFGDTGTNIIGTRHGEKLYETLMTREERLRSEDMGHYFRVAADNRDLNYDKYFVQGKVGTQAEESYTSHNTIRLDVEGVVKKILTTDYVQEELKGIRHNGGIRMKKVVSVNLGNHGSTGKIMKGISAVAQANGFETYMAYPASLYTRTVENNDIIICSSFWNRVNQKVAYYTGLNGCFAPVVTRKFLKRMDQINPNIFHFHNLHNSYINLPMLFDYVKHNRIKVLWTLHDCWAFTGHCPYFTLATCEKWKTGCGNCPQLNVYPPARIDKTNEMWKRKKQWFSGVENLTIVTPSKWLAGLVEQSFLSQYPIKVINNGIDLSVFKPRESDVRNKYDIPNEKIVLLGVSFGWGDRKGLDVFKYLASKLAPRYQIILVGTDDNIDRELPPNIISIHRTQDQIELMILKSSNAGLMLSLQTALLMCWQMSRRRFIPETYSGETKTV